MDIFLFGDILMFDETMCLLLYFKATNRFLPFQSVLIFHLFWKNVYNQKSLCAPTVVIAPKLVIEKTGPAEVLICEPITYKVVVRNTGDGPAENVKVSDELPAGLRTVDGSSTITAERQGISKRWQLLLVGIKSIVSVEGGAVENTPKGVLVTPVDDADCLKISLDVTA